MNRSVGVRGLGPVKLGQAIDPRNNALNAWRLAAASGVLLWHSYGLTGRESDVPAPVAQFLGHVPVDGFFAMSGFLITGSWLRNPSVRTYLAARALRLLPGLWVCLLLTGFVLAPIAMAVQHGPRIFGSWAPLKYFLMNFTTVTMQGDIGGTPQSVPYPAMWNGSLWNLQFEVFCYLALMVFGLIGLLKLRWFIGSVTLLALVWSAALPPWTDTPISIAQILARFTLMFSAGALLYQLRDVVPAHWSIVAVCAVIVLGACFLPNYRLLAALPLTYLLIVSGALIRHHRLMFRNDLSYGVFVYGWPVQQFLVVLGLGFLNPLLFTGVVAIPVVALAALSWFVVEKRTLALRSRLTRRLPDQARERAPSDRRGDDVKGPAQSARPQPATVRPRPDPSSAT